MSDFPFHEPAKVKTIALGNVRIEIYPPIFERTIFVLCMIISNSLLLKLVNRIYLKIDFVIIDFFYAMLVYPLLFLAPLLFVCAVWGFLRSKYNVNSYSFTSILLLILASVIEVIAVV